MSTPPELNSSDPQLTLSTIFPIKIILPAVTVLSILFLIVLMVYFRIKNQSDSLWTSSSSLALNTAVLKALPITIFSSTNSNCAICLSDLTDGELGRLLPGCNHGFHLDCIDKWFLVDSSCPICRSSVNLPQDLPASYSGTKSATFVMEAAYTDIKEGVLHRTASSMSAAATVERSVLGRRAEEMRPPSMASLRWLRRIKCCICSSIGLDVEQGVAVGNVFERDFHYVYHVI